MPQKLRPSSVWLTFAMLSLILASFFPALALQAEVADSPTPPPDIPLTMILQQGRRGYDGCEDTSINSWFRDVNFGDGSSLWVRSGDEIASLLRFDVAVLPPGAVLREATLSLYPVTGGDHAMTLGLYAILTDWSADDASWTHSSATQYWQIDGCNEIGRDREATAIITDATSLFDWLDMDVTPLVQRWLADPASNRGVAIKSFDTRWSVGYGFASANHGNISFRPKLTLIWSLSSDEDADRPPNAHAHSDDYLIPNRHGYRNHYADSDGDDDSNAYSHAEPLALRNQHGYRYGDRIFHSHLDRHGYHNALQDANGHAYADRYRDGDNNAYGHAHMDADRICNPNRHRQSDEHCNAKRDDYDQSDADQHSSADRDTERYGHCHPNADQRYDAACDAKRDSHRQSDDHKHLVAYGDAKRDGDL